MDIVQKNNARTRLIIQVFQFVFLKIQIHKLDQYPKRFIKVKYRFLFHHSDKSVFDIYYIRKVIIKMSQIRRDFLKASKNRKNYDYLLYFAKFPWPLKNLFKLLTF